MSELNKTTIVLIMKIGGACNMSDFWSISLCNVTYRIVTKTLAYMLKKYLGSIISPYHSAFVPGRLIAENIMVALELLHSISKKKKKLGLLEIGYE